MSNPLNDPTLEKLVKRLHDRSKQQSPESAAYFARRAQNGASATLDEAEKKCFLSDKLVALEPEKALFCYQLCRALNARRVVEIGTSFGVSTMYLAAALRDNARLSAGDRVVIGTEYEPDKVRCARRHFAEAGLAQFIDLREGDLRETLRDVGGPVDFVLVDIWIRMARPALELIAPSLRPGAVVVCDNTTTHRDDYRDYLAFLDDPRNRFRTLTIPFPGGLEFSIRD